MKELIRHTWFYSWFTAYRQRADYRAWVRSGRKVAAPHLQKQIMIKDYARQRHLTVFVETGTYRGDMVEAVRNSFERIYSIELSPLLHQRAAQRFAKHKHIRILLGDSTQVLPTVLTEIAQPCLFWLDGHFSAGITAKGSKNTPVSDELRYIFNHPIQRHMILIDDARAFNGQNDYPTLRELEDYLKGLGYSGAFVVQNDVIHLDLAAS